MSKDSRAWPFESVSRRSLLRAGLGAAMAGAFASQGLAQGAGASAEWEQRFDSAAGTGRLKRSMVPLLSAQTVSSTEQALAQYIQLEAAGGWRPVPGGAVLRLGTRHPNVAALRERLMVSGDLDRAAGVNQTFDSYVEGAVRRFQSRHGLIASGVVSDATIAAMNVPVSVRRHQLETNIVRLRSMSGFLGDRFVTVNIPGAQIEAVEGGQVALRHTAVVGKPDRASPTLNVKIQEVNFNPFWTVPVSIVKKDLIPKMQADPEYLDKNRIRIYDQRGNALTPQQINWNSDEAVNYMFRQDPGEINSMGAIRINMPNKDGVYMHDTPSKNLFGEDFRFHSSGCVRVQNVRELVDWLLKKNGGWDRQKIDAVIRSGERVDAKLAQAVPVYWVYITAWADPEGLVQFREDVYSRDGIQETASRTL